MLRMLLTASLMKEGGTPRKKHTVLRMVAGYTVRITGIQQETHGDVDIFAELVVPEKEC
jgi:hypothetical protein